MSSLSDSFRLWKSVDASDGKNSPVTVETLYDYTWLSGVWKMNILKWFHIWEIEKYTQIFNNTWEFFIKICCIPDHQADHAPSFEIPYQMVISLSDSMGKMSALTKFASDREHNATLLKDADFVNKVLHWRMYNFVVAKNGFFVVGFSLNGCLRKRMTHCKWGDDLSHPTIIKWGSPHGD